MPNVCNWNKPTWSGNENLSWPIIIGCHAQVVSPLVRKTIQVAAAAVLFSLFLCVSVLNKRTWSNADSTHDAQQSYIVTRLEGSMSI